MVGEQSILFSLLYSYLCKTVHTSHLHNFLFLTMHCNHLVPWWWWLFSLTAHVLSCPNSRNFYLNSSNSIHSEISKNISFIVFINIPIWFFPSGEGGGWSRGIIYLFTSIFINMILIFSMCLWKRFWVGRFWNF